MRRQPMRFIDVVLASGQDICLASVSLYIMGSALDLRVLQFLAFLILTWPVVYVVAYVVMMALLDDD